jgi:uncharacterized protein YndB with AHSA1/START domain
MVKKILLGLLAVVVLFLIVVALQPGEFKVTRSATMNAPAELVFNQVNDFHKWQKWSPWEKLDPEMKKTIDGPDAGVGAKYAWSGNKEVGEGRMEITESKPSELILIKLDFIKPMQSTNMTEFTFKPEGDQTKVTWTMSGKNDFLGKAFCLFMNMDKMIGGDFEKGLEAMKKEVEPPL